MSSGQTIVVYGNLTLLHCVTTIEQKCIMDPSGTDMKCLQSLVHVTGYIHGHQDWRRYQEPVYSEVWGPGAEDINVGNAAKNHIMARYRLPPRQAFTMAVGCSGNTTGSGTVLLSAIPMSAAGSIPSSLNSGGLTNYDVNDGPRCPQFNVVHVSGNEVFKVSAVFEIHKVECDDEGRANGNTNGVLSNRWSCTDNIDTNMRTTRTYKGLLELATSRFSPHWFRYLCLPPLSDGMRRDFESWTATEDGKKLAWSVTDTEIAISAPYPATKWSINYSEGAHTGQKGFGTIDITLEGDSNVNKRDLISIALSVVENKLKRLDPTKMRPAESYLLEDLLITDHIGDVNAISVHASMSRTASNDVGNFANVSGGMLGTIIPAAELPAFDATYNPRQSRGGRTGEVPEYEGPVSLIGIFRCYLQNPCGIDHGINSNNILATNENLPTSATPYGQINAVVVPTITDTEVPYYSQSHKEQMYRVYKCESLYKSNEMRVAMPRASAPYVPPEETPDAVDNSDATCFVSLCRPQSRLTVRIVAERVGEWPEMPDPEKLYMGEATHAPGYSPGSPTLTASPIGMKLLKSKLLPGTKHYTATGAELYRVRMEATYALKRKPGPTEILKIGSNPWTTGRVEVSNTTLTNSNDPWNEVTPEEEEA